MEAFWNTAEVRLLLTVGLAMVLGGVVGLERESADKPAGLRTHMLVSGASALLVGLGESTLDHYASLTTDSLLRTDPIRIIEAVVTGVAFLGAGTIIRDRGGVKGLTTAASLLMSAAMGVAVALSQIVVAVGVAVLSLVVLRVLPMIESSVKKGT